MYYQKCLNLQYFLLNLVLDPIKCILYICLKLRVLFEDRVINSYKINNLQTFENLAYIRLAEEGFGLGKSNGGWVEVHSLGGSFCHQMAVAAPSHTRNFLASSSCAAAAAAAELSHSQLSTN